MYRNLRQKYKKYLPQAVHVEFLTKDTYWLDKLVEVHFVYNVVSGSDENSGSLVLVVAVRGVRRLARKDLSFFST